MVQPTNTGGMPLSLLYINCSPPSGVPEAQWEHWLTTTQIPGIVNSGNVVRAALYKETGFEMIPNPSHPLEYMFLYQTDCERLQGGKRYRSIKDTESNIYSASKDDDTRNYELIQDYNPFGRSNQPGPQLLTVEMHPDDREDFEDCYRKELLPKLSSLPGYRRCRRYQIKATKNGDNHYLAFHELEDLSKAFKSQAQHDQATTPRIEKHIEASEKNKTDRGSGFVRRGWVLLHAEGYPVETKQFEFAPKEPAQDDSETSSVKTGCIRFKQVLSRLFHGSMI